MTRLDSQLDEAFARVGLTEEEPVTADTPSFGPSLEVDPQPLPQSPDTRLASNSELAQYQELFDLQTQQLNRITLMNQESMDNIMTFLERLGFADQVLQRKQIDNMLTILERLGLVTPTETQPQPEGPTPVATQ